MCRIVVLLLDALSKSASTTGGRGQAVRLPPMARDQRGFVRVRWQDDATSPLPARAGAGCIVGNDYWERLTLEEFDNQMALIRAK